MEFSGFCSTNDTREAELLLDTGKDGGGWKMGQSVVGHEGQMFFFLSCGRIAFGGTGAVLSSAMVGVNLILRLKARGEQGGHVDKPGAGRLAWDS